MGSIRFVIVQLTTSTDPPLPTNELKSKLVEILIVSITSLHSSHLRFEGKILTKASSIGAGSKFLNEVAFMSIEVEDERYSPGHCEQATHDEKHTVQPG